MIKLHFHMYKIDCHSIVVNCTKLFDTIFSCTKRRGSEHSTLLHLSDKQYDKGEDCYCQNRQYISMSNIDAILVEENIGGCNNQIEASLKTKEPDSHSTLTLSSTNGKRRNCKAISIGTRCSGSHHTIFSQSKSEHQKRNQSTESLFNEKKSAKFNPLISNKTSLKLWSSNLGMVSFRTNWQQW